MATFHLSTLRQVRDPVRVPEWNASIAAGDDFKLALTVYADDAGAAADVTGSRSRLALWPDDYPSDGARSRDYDAAWWTGGSLIPTVFGRQLQIDGAVTSVRAGGLNFHVSSSTTSRMHRRYRLIISVDLADGSFCQTSGVLQLRAPMTMGLTHGSVLFFQLAVSGLSTAQLAPAVIDGVPVDADGFLF